MGDHPSAVEEPNMAANGPVDEKPWSVDSGKNSVCP